MNTNSVWVSATHFLNKNLQRKHQLFIKFNYTPHNPICIPKKRNYTLPVYHIIYNSYSCLTYSIRYYIYGVNGRRSLSNDMTSPVTKWLVNSRHLVSTRVLLCLNEWDACKTVYLWYILISLRWWKWGMEVTSGVWNYEMLW